MQIGKRQKLSKDHPIPDTGKFYGVPLPILRIISAEIGKFIKKEPSKAKLLLEILTLLG